jgi:hypothetical protein
VGKILFPNYQSWNREKDAPALYPISCKPSPSPIWFHFLASADCTIDTIGGAQPEEVFFLILMMNSSGANMSQRLRPSDFASFFPPHWITQ